METKQPIDQSARDSVIPGVYEHFKGNIYRVFGVAEDTETGKLTVFYSPQYGQYKGKLCNRELGMFLEIVRNHKDRPGYEGPRFRLIEPMPMIREGGMTPQKLREVFAIYEKFFQERKATPEAYPYEMLLPQFGNHEAFSHCFGMLVQMQAFLEVGRIEKLMHWLGFLQGVLWAKGAYKLEELMQHNQPNTEK